MNGEKQTTAFENCLGSFSHSHRRRHPGLQCLINNGKTSKPKDIVDDEFKIKEVLREKIHFSLVALANQQSFLEKHFSRFTPEHSNSQGHKYKFHLSGFNIF